MNNTLGDLVKRKMDKENLSLRKAGKQAGVAHTTIDRALNGESLDYQTLEKICDWLGVPVITVIDAQQDNKKQDYNIKTLEKIAKTVALCPEFEEVFSEVAEEVLAGKLSISILDEITSFASFRLYKHQERTNQNTKQQAQNI